MSALPIDAGCPAAQEDHEGGAPVSILLVEDDPLDADLIGASLRGMPAHRLVRAGSARRAVELAGAEAFDVILLDLSQPDVRGLGGLEWIRRASPGSALIVLSEDENDAIGARAMQEGAQDHLVKGQMDRRQLLRAIRFAAERKRAESRLARLSHFDLLTGLAGRLTFEETLEQMVARGRRSRAPFAVARVDLDGFRGVNEALGHSAGDAVLRSVAERLRSSVRAYDTVARLEQDDFGLVVEEIEGETAAESLAKRLARELRFPMRLAEGEVTVTSSIGIACYPSAGTTPHELLHGSEAAMNMARARGRDRFVVWSSRWDAAAARPDQLGTLRQWRGGEKGRTYR